MGLVTFVNRANGEEVETDFPLHPTLVAFKGIDGFAGQLFRADFDALYAQKLPELPPAVLNAEGAAVEPGDPVGLVAAGGKPPASAPYVAPTVKTIPAPAVVSHIDVSWFLELDNKIAALHAKLDALLNAHPAIQKAVEHVEQLAIGWAAQKVEQAAPAVAPVVEAVIQGASKS